MSTEATTDEPTTADEDLIPPAPAGWRRMLIGLLIGLLAGALLALLLPRERSVPEADPEPTAGDPPSPLPEVGDGDDGADR